MRSFRVANAAPSLGAPKRGLLTAVSLAAIALLLLVCTPSLAARKDFFRKPRFPSVRFSVHRSSPKDVQESGRQEADYQITLTVPELTLSHGQIIITRQLHADEEWAKKFQSLSDEYETEWDERDHRVVYALPLPGVRGEGQETCLLQTEGGVLEVDDWLSSDSVEGLEAASHSAKSNPASADTDLQRGFRPRLFFHRGATFEQDYSDPFGRTFLLVSRFRTRFSPRKGWMAQTRGCSNNAASTVDAYQMKLGRTLKIEFMTVVALQRRFVLTFADVEELHPSPLSSFFPVKEIVLEGELKASPPPLCPALLKRQQIGDFEASRERAVEQDPSNGTRFDKGTSAMFAFHRWVVVEDLRIFGASKADLQTVGGLYFPAAFRPLTSVLSLSLAERKLAEAMTMWQLSDELRQNEQTEVHEYAHVAVGDFSASWVRRFFQVTRRFLALRRKTMELLLFEANPHIMELAQHDGTPGVRRHYEVTILFSKPFSGWISPGEVREVRVGDWSLRGSTPFNDVEVPQITEASQIYVAICSDDHHPGTDVHAMISLLDFILSLDIDVTLNIISFNTPLWLDIPIRTSPALSEEVNDAAAAFHKFLITKAEEKRLFQGKKATLTIGSVCKAGMCGGYSTLEQSGDRNQVVALVRNRRPDHKPHWGSLDENSFEIWAKLLNDIPTVTEWFSNFIAFQNNFSLSQKHSTAPIDYFEPAPPLIETRKW